MLAEWWKGGNFYWAAAALQLAINCGIYLCPAVDIQDQVLTGSARNKKFFQFRFKAFYRGDKIPQKCPESFAQNQKLQWETLSPPIPKDRSRRNTDSIICYTLRWDYSVATGIRNGNFLVLDD